MATEYITQQGDCWDAIALRLWGDEHLMDRLIAANIEYMDMLEFPAGVRLNVPDGVKKTGNQHGASAVDVTNLKADGNAPKGGEAVTVGRVFEPLRASIATRREQRRADSAETARTRLARGRMLRRFAAEEVLPPWM